MRVQYYEPCEHEISDLPQLSLCESRLPSSLFDHLTAWTWYLFAKVEQLFPVYHRQRRQCKECRTYGEK